MITSTYLKSPIFKIKTVSVKFLKEADCHEDLVKNFLRLYSSVTNCFMFSLPLPI